MTTTLVRFNRWHLLKHFSYIYEILKPSFKNHDESYVCLDNISTISSFRFAEAYSKAVFPASSFIPTSTESPNPSNHATTSVFPPRAAKCKHVIPCLPRQLGSTPTSFMRNRIASKSPLRPESGKRDSVLAPCVAPCLRKSRRMVVACGNARWVDSEGDEEPTMREVRMWSGACSSCLGSFPEVVLGLAPDSSRHRLSERKTDEMNRQ